MRLAGNVIVFLSLLLLTAGAVGAQTHEESVEESNRKFGESMKAMSDFVKDVSFDESDIKDMIAHWKEINALGEENERRGGHDDGEDDEMIDFDEILADSAYRSWAKSKGFDPDRWMRKFMRIQMMLMKDSITAAASDGSAQLEAQLAEIEAQRAQIGEEMYQQIVQAIKMGATTMSNINTAYDGLPEPTPAEKALLDKYRDQLMNLE